MHLRRGGSRSLSGAIVLHFHVFIYIDTPFQLFQNCRGGYRDIATSIASYAAIVAGALPKAEGGCQIVCRWHLTR